MLLGRQANSQQTQTANLLSLACLAPQLHAQSVSRTGLRYWQSDNRTSTAVLPHLRATQKGNLARPHSRSPQAVRKPEGPAMHCHLHRGDWDFHLTNEKKKKRQIHVLPHSEVAYQSCNLTWSPGQPVPATPCS